MGTVVHAGSGTGVVVADRGPSGVRADRAQARGAPARDRVPDRAARLLHAARPGRRGAHRRHLRHQRSPAPPGHRRAAVLPGHRGRYLPAVAARGGVHQPCRRIPAAGPPQGPGQTAGVHRGPRRHRRPVHRQDRHPDRGQHQLHALRRPRRPHRRRAAAAGAAVQRGLRRRRPRGGRQPARHGTVELAGLGTRATAALAGYRRLATLPFDHERRAGLGAGGGRPPAAG